MTKSFKYALHCATLMAALAAMSAGAAESIYKNENSSGSVELTNLEEGDTAQTKIVEGTTKDTTAVSAESTAKTKLTKSDCPKPKAKRPAKKTLGANESEETAVVDEEIACEEPQAAADPTSPVSDSATAKVGSSPDVQARTEDSAAASNSVSYGGSGNGVVANGTGTGIGTSASAGTNASSTGSVPSESGTNTAGTGTAASGSGAGSTSADNNTALSGVPAILSKYRNLMLQEATSANYINSNPAISRRYLQVNRSTYQARIGQ
jgi:hypothetical protein